MSGHGVQDCPLKKCEIKKLVVKCSHGGGRKLVLDVKRGTLGRLHVIGDSRKGDELTVEVSGHCDFGKSSSSPRAAKAEELVRLDDGNHCPLVVIAGPDTQVEQPGTVKVLALSEPPSTLAEDWLTFFRYHIVPPTQVGTSVPIRAENCLGAQPFEAVVVVHPPASWDGKVSLGYAHEKHRDAGKKASRRGQLKNTSGQWTLEGSIEVTFDTRKFTLGADKKKKGPKRDDSALAQGFFDGAQAVLNRITPLLGDVKAQYAQVSIRWPKLTLSGGIALAEVEGKPDVDLEGKIALAFEPLFGAEFTVDILEILIDVGVNSVAPGFGKFLLKVKKLAAEGGGNAAVAGKAVIAIDFKVGGELGGSLGWKKPKGKSFAIDGSKAEVKGSIGFSLTGKVHAEGRVFKLTAAAGASISAKGAEEGTSESQLYAAWRPFDDGASPTLKVVLGHTGLAIWYAYYARVGVESARPTGRNKTQRRDRGEDLIDDSKLAQQDLGVEETKWATLIEPARWPAASDAPRSLKEGV